ncbi:hypothetical protein PICMEDRAFT_11342 [Pichia membranifaciens NRRL Y-2026]|uniref:Spt20-like SEP domain-containing protein n=1 Tax=Pichia membranifaciens NRRL Y-2026 TaxID=763406 RepID=A0A1E3NJL6_9ASCO|nr:hypothetical protein PICMEDRAFT_11342 [Pichia membranifaciens NRRL Y-2026]ODQ46335.1 hypothetical protein PICMEDRAFT_11342 [Pichia membranifaciens NRRL Y-2026]
MSTGGEPNNLGFDQNGQTNGLGSFMDPVNQMGMAQSPNQPSPVDHMGQLNQLNMNPMSQMNSISQGNQMGQMSQLNQMNQINHLAPAGVQMNLNAIGQINNQHQLGQMGQRGHVGQMNQMNNASQMGHMGQASPQQRQQGSEVRGWNPAYVQSLLRKIQPGPGMTKQQRFQQLLRSGELTRTDVQILQRHQQMLRQAQAVRQKQLHQRALQQQQQQQQTSSYSGKSIPGKSLPGKKVPGKSVPGKSLPGKSLPGKSLPGKSLPGKSLPGKSLPGKSLPGKTVSGKTVPGKSLPGTGTPEFSPSLSHASLGGKSLPVNSTSQRTSGTETPMQISTGMSLPVNSPLAANLISASPLNNINSPVNPAVNLSVNQPVNSPVNLPLNQHINQPVNRPVNQPVNEPVNKPVNQSVNQYMSQMSNAASLVQQQAGIPQGNQVNGSVNPSQAHLEQLKQQEHQKKLLQQRQQQKYFNLTAEQYDKLNVQQKQLLKLQYLRRKAKTQRFYESDQELLKKYENSPPSLDFHIHEEHYRFGHNENLIPKNDPAIKDFLTYVAKKKIPDALMEIIKDGNIQLYDGNIILRIYDHRIVDDASLLPPKEPTPVPSSESKDLGAMVPNINPSVPAANDSLENSSNQSPDKINANASTTSTEIPESKNEKKAPKRFKEYRTILRLTQSALYEDFCLTTDTQMFGDSFVLTYESEILTAITRSVNLQPTNNPYLQGRSLWPTSEMVFPHYDEKEDRMIFTHRQDMRELVKSKLNHKKRALTYENYDYKPLHQDGSQSNSKYEKLMLIMGKSSPHSNISASKQSVEVPRFERLRFIENLRHQNLIKKENNLRGVSSIQSPPVGYTSFGSVMGNINNQKSFSFQGKNADNSTMADGEVKSEDNGGNSTSAANSKGKAGKASAGKNSTPRKKNDKPKKPRKPTKKQLAAQAAAQAATEGIPDGTSATSASEPPKKKRAPAKKKNAANTPVTPAN